MRNSCVRQIQELALLVGIVASATAVHAQTYTPLYHYPETSEGDTGISAPSLLSQGQDGDLYSTIRDNGVHPYGSVYKMTTSGDFTLLYSFCAEGGSCPLTGDVPQGGVTLGFDGNLWGTTVDGGKDNCGTVFKTTPAGTLTSVYSFTCNGGPIYTVLQGQDGNMYGVTPYGGGYGTFFKLTTKGVITFHDFDYTDGENPNLPVQGTDLNFYGTTQYGGNNGTNCGVIYKATAAGKISVLHNFKGYPTDGCRPIGVLVQGYDGNFYGTTYSGGDAKLNGNGNGTVFKITRAGVYTLLHSFTYGKTASKNPYDAQLPTAGLTLGTDGNLYGVGEYGGSLNNGGAIFEITATGTEKVLYSFCSVTCNDGFLPTTPMVLHTDGKFYGNTAGNSLCCSDFYSFGVGFKPFVNLVTWTGKVGATVEILGQGFTGTTGVSFNGVAAKFDNVSETYMTATVPAGATTGTVTVTTFTGVFKSNRTFLVTPQLTSFIPLSGTVGTSVTITGVSLTQTTAVTIGGEAATFKVLKDTSVTAIVPAGAKTGEKISITTAGGIATSSANFAVVPKITSFKPTSGPVGTDVTITGNSFTGTTKVTFNGVAASSFEVISDTEARALVPTGAKTGKIEVTTTGGTGTSSTNFTVTK